MGISFLNKATFPGPQAPQPLFDADISGTTGSPTTGTYTDGGVDYKFYKFTGTGSITFTKAGLVDTLLIAGGGGGGYNNYGAGAGGMVYETNYYVTAATQTVLVGAGGAIANRGGTSKLANLTAVNGGFVRFNVNDNACFGGSSGSANAGTTAGQNVVGQGNVGGVSGSAAGGGGAGGAGAAGGAAGAGLANLITGTSVTYATGGASNTGSGAANTGNGAGGYGISNLGGSGIVIVRVVA